VAHISRAHRLTFGVDGQRDVHVSPLTGAAERAAGGDAQALLRALMVGVDADRLTVGDRDRLLAETYATLYGWNVLADARCTGCGARFELRFSLRTLLDTRQPDGTAQGTPPTLAVSGARLRLPTVADRADSPEHLVRMLTIDGDPPPLADAESALEAADPALELDLSGTCPECHAAQAAPFSMAGLLGATLARDHRFLMREVHLLARTYGWDLASILSLTRTERHEFVRLILADQSAARPVVRRVS
jgi:hypothetical protein